MILKDDTLHLRYKSLREFFEETNPKGKILTKHSHSLDEIRGMASGSDGSWRYGDEKKQNKFYEARFDPKKGKDLCAADVKKTMETKEYKDLVKQAMRF